jgi:hypothetical protein
LTDCRSEPKNSNQEHKSRILQETVFKDYFQELEAAIAISLVFVAVVAAVPSGESVLLLVVFEVVLAPVEVAVAVGIPEFPGAAVPKTVNSQGFRTEGPLSQLQSGCLQMGHLSWMQLMRSLVG